MVSLELRTFGHENASEDTGVAITTQLEVKYQVKDLRLVLAGLARLDALDDRNVVLPEDFFASYDRERVSLTVGTRILNWSATEGFQPADVMNSRNFDSEFENLEKIGEPMVELKVRLLQGHLSLYYMPIRMEPNQLDSSSPLSFVPPEFEVGDALWIDRNGKSSDSVVDQQGAVHLTQTIGPADVSVYAIDHADRDQPTYTFDPETMNTLRPTYFQVFQTGMTYVQVIGGLIVKLDGAYKRFAEPDLMANPLVTPQNDHVQMAAGLEYNWTTRAGHDATAILEGQRFFAENRRIRDELHPFQNDVLVAYRHFFNDVKGRELTLLFITDLEDPREYVASLRYNQRLADAWKVNGALRRLHLLGADALQINVSLARHF